MSNLDIHGESGNEEIFTRLSTTLLNDMLIEIRFDKYIPNAIVIQMESNLIAYFFSNDTSFTET